MNLKNLKLTVLLLFLVFGYCTTESNSTRSGLDRVSEYDSLFAEKRIGIITNHTAYNSKGKFITEVFREIPEVRIAALFGPEHGVRGKAEAGEMINTGTDPVLKVPVYSLYGKTRKPTPEMLADTDLLVFDIQDIGARFYTYIYTMALAMEAAAENDIPFIVLDRPNPINGISMEGNVLDTAYASFVGMYPIPVRHGMTVGELARMFNSEGWLKNGVRAKLTVIPMVNWQRSFWYDKTGLEFIPPSPNMPDLLTATLYPGLCLIEGTNVSEGRGTNQPFQIFGAPWISAKKLKKSLNDLNLSGVRFKDTTFTPAALEGKAENPKFRDRECQGARVIVTDRDLFRPYYAGIQILNTLYRLNPDSTQFRSGGIRRLSGTDRLEPAIIQRQNLDSLYASWQRELNQFMEIRERYVLYE